MPFPSNKPELLSPAGDWTMLTAVINNGADAVYFGIEELNMRAAAGNFSPGELKKISRLCKSKNVKTQLTLNIILFDHEIEKAEEIIVRAKESGIDYIVCWDLAAAALCKKHSMPFCISTQGSVSNSLAVKQYQMLGAKRIVLARECSLAQIRGIKKHTDIEIETFIHGAMCIAVSGRCLMSHEVFGRSANRGDCLQSCRREYEIYDRRKDTTLHLGTNYVMSSKDLCGLDIIEQLIESGIDSFKIEGRKRSPEYAAETTRVYRKAIDAYFEGTLDQSLKTKLREELSGVYNRGFCDGFYLEPPSANGFTEADGNASSVRKEFIGRIVNYYGKKKIAYAEVQSNSIDNGDSLLIIGQTTGVAEVDVVDLRVNDLEGSTAAKGDYVTFPCPEKVRTGDKVYRKIKQ